MTLSRKENAHYRSREYLTLAEVERLIMAAELRGRHPIRDKALLLVKSRQKLKQASMDEAYMLKVLGTSIPLQSSLSET